MSYLGRSVDAISNVEKLDNITFNGGTTYALTKSSAAFTPAGKNNILISVSGVVQQGNFSVSGSNIVFDSAVAGTESCDFIMHYGTGLITTPADDTVSASFGDCCWNYGSRLAETSKIMILFGEGRHWGLWTAFWKHRPFGVFVNRLPCVDAVPAVLDFAV